MANEPHPTPHAPSRDDKLRALDQALTVTYFFIALSGGAIAFLLQEPVLTNLNMLWERIAIAISALCFFASCGAGIIVCMRAPVVVQMPDFDLEDVWLKMFGGLNVLLFAAGIVPLAFFVMSLLWSYAPDAPSAPT